MKLVYNIAGTYRPAGMERVLANKVAWLSQHGYEILIVTTDQRGRKPFFELPEGVRTVDLGIDYETNNGGSFLNKLVHYPLKQIKHKRALKKLLFEERPDITISMFCNDAGFLPKIKDGSKKVLEIHFSKFKRLQYGRKGIWRLADIYRSRQDQRDIQRFDKFIVLTNEDREYWGDLENIDVIPNARTYSTDTPSSLDKKFVVAAGRFSAQKNFKELLDVWSLIKDKLDWKLWIIGDGEQREMLEERIKSLNISDSVILGTLESDMQAVYRKSSIYALTSKYEGLPMVLLEAQAMGLPIVAYTCKCGPKDVVTDGVDGFLVEEGNKQEFAERLSLLMSVDDLRKRMGAAAYKNSDRFDEETIMSRWDNLFKSLAR